MNSDQARKEHDAAQRVAHKTRGAIKSAVKFVDNFLAMDAATVHPAAYERARKGAGILEATLPTLRARLAEALADIARTAPHLPPVGRRADAIRSFVFRTRVTPMTADEMAALELPAFLRRTAEAGR